MWEIWWWHGHLARGTAGYTVKMPVPPPLHHRFPDRPTIFWISRERPDSEPAASCENGKGGRLVREAIAALPSSRPFYGRDAGVIVGSRWPFLGIRSNSLESTS